jgi:hypothetical protein
MYVIAKRTVMYSRLLVAIARERYEYRIVQYTNGHSDKFFASAHIFFTQTFLLYFTYLKRPSSTNSTATAASQGPTRSLLFHPHTFSLLARTFGNVGEL